MAHRFKDKCPSCFQPIAKTDFLCSHCELILDPSQMPDKPGKSEVSLVRRMLEPPQSGMPAAVPDKKAALQKTQGAEGPTRKLDLGPELAGVPIVVASLSKRSQSLTELEAWLVSLIDGQSDARALAERANLREFELRVILRTLNEKHIIDFADEPLSDESFALPFVEGTLEGPDEDEPMDFAMSAPPQIAPVQAAPPPEPPPAPVIVPRTPRRATGAPPFPSAKPRAPIAANPSTPSGGSAALPPSFVPTPARATQAVAEAPKERLTDPRIAYTGTPNRRILDALKQVKRADTSGPAAPSKPAGGDSESVADVLARDSLQIALRMEQNGRMDEAIRFLEKSIAKSPDAASLYNRLGLIVMRERADYRRAEQLIRKASDLAPENQVYATNLRQLLSHSALKATRR